MLTTYPLFHHVSRAVGPSSDRGVDRTWSASVASPSAAGRSPGDGAPGSQAARPCGCGTTARATRRCRRTRCGVRVDGGSTAPSVSITWRFARTTGLLDAPQRPAKSPERHDLLLSMLVQDVAHGRDGARSSGGRQRLGRLCLVAGFQVSIDGRFWVVYRGFRDVHGIAPITKEVLIQRTAEYKQWVEAFARDHGVPITWAEAGVKKEDHVRPYHERFARRRGVGVYFIFRSMEQGPKFHVLPQKAADPTYRLIRRTRGRCTHFYLYIRDEVVGPFVMCVGSFLPFQTTYYLNGHHVIASGLERRRIPVQRDDHAFLARADPVALQAAADRLTADVIRKRLDYWTRVLGPKFSREDQAAVHLRREYSLNQVEYCR